MCDIDEVSGCQDLEACNYNALATNNDGSCAYIDGICESCVDGVIVDNDSDDDTACDDIDACPLDPNNDIDNDGICGDIDICPFDSENDADNDSICDSFDPCVGIYDECGECNGSGIAEGVCDCMGNTEDCAGECGGLSIIDDCDQCNGNNYFGSEVGDLCDCFENTIDNCGLCGGNNSSCTALLSLGVIDAACTTESCSGTLEILYDFPGPVAGFQFDISNINISDTNGGISDLFTISSSNNTVIGFSFSGQQILMGSGILLIVEFDNILGDTTSIDESSVILSYPGGDQQYLASVQGNSIIHPMDCANSYYGEVLEGCDNICGSGHINDCTGICISPEQIISGDGIFNDCNGVCGGDSYLDCAGICDNNINNDLGHDYDQDGICDEIDICPGFEYYNFSGDLVCLDAEQPYELLLKQNYPNPFNPYTNIEFYLDFNDYIELNIYDIKGRKVKTLLSEFSLSGSHIVKWDGKNKNGDDLPSGIYLYQLVNSQNMLSNKMILLR